MKIILLCSAQANQKALAHKIAANFNLVGVVVEKKKVKSNKLYTFKNIFTKLSNLIFFRRITGAWQQMLQFYNMKYDQFPATKILEVSSINSADAKLFITDNQADLVMVSGTSLLKKNILEIQLPVGIINLHTGLSPYIKGSPNCTNWCIASRQFHLIGNTIMWIDAGIDSGDLLCTAIVKFTGNESLSDIHIKVMEEAHALYLQTVKSMGSNTLQRVKQNSIAAGTTYYSKDWNYKQKRRLLKNMRYFNKEVNTAEYLNKMASIVTVNIQ